MKLIIDIPEEEYELIVNDEACGLNFLTRAIANGTPLPNIFDLEGLKSDMKALNCGYPYGLDYLLDCLKKRLGITIIEADMKSEDIRNDQI